MALAVFKTDGWELLDGEQLHAAHPSTFHIPPEHERENLVLPCHVKLSFRINIVGEHLEEKERVERMWVWATMQSNGQYLGRLDNDPLSKRLSAGMMVTFEPRHIISTW